MKVKNVMAMLASIALAAPLGAQMMGMGSQVPTLSGIWRPVVGTGSS